MAILARVVDLKQNQARFRRIWQSGCAYNSLRCLHLEIWQFLCWQWQQQMDKPITLPLAHACRVVTNTEFRYSLVEHSVWLALILTSNRTSPTYSNYGYIMVLPSTSLTWCYISPRPSCFSRATLKIWEWSGDEANTRYISVYNIIHLFSPHVHRATSSLRQSEHLPLQATQSLRTAPAPPTGKEKTSKKHSTGSLMLSSPASSLMLSRGKPTRSTGKTYVHTSEL